MNNKQLWVPTKVIQTRYGFAPGPTVGTGSLFIANIHTKLYTSCLKQHARGILLDLGCGAVPYFICYKEFIQDVVCADWPNSLHGNDFVDCSVNLDDPLAIPDASFDTVLMTDVLEHVFKPSQVLAEVSRLLRPGGKLILTVPFYYWIHEGPHDYFRYTDFALRRLCNENSLDVLECDSYGGVPEILCDIVSKCLASTRIGRSMCGGFAKSAAFLLKVNPAKWASEKTRRLFPLGYCLVAMKRDCSHQSLA